MLGAICRSAIQCAATGAPAANNSSGAHKRAGAAGVAAAVLGRVRHAEPAAPPQLAAEFHIGATEPVVGLGPEGAAIDLLPQELPDFLSQRHRTLGQHQS